MAKNAMFYLVILSVILALAFATNKKDAKEAENHSAGIFGKVGRFVTVALAVSSRLGGAGASQGDGAVHGGEKAVANIRSNQLPNNNWMAPPPPMPMKSAEVDGRKSSRINLKKAAEYFEKRAQEVRKLTGIKPQRDVPSGPDQKHH
uniref:CLAVATA3/ESR-like protein n=1 Tax=Globodera pallida TaxID=36090 RepID=A0A0K0KDJ7_GLOPA|nr:CLAVATA3/ESR-like protein [Globodera pallida]